MGFAAVNKIFLVFEEPWWTPDIKGFQLIWSKDNNVTPSHKEVNIKQLIIEYLTMPSCLCKGEIKSCSSSSLYGEEND
jgi:hypothetical protein